MYCTVRMSGLIMRESYLRKKTKNPDVCPILTFSLHFSFHICGRHRNGIPRLSGSVTHKKEAENGNIPHVQQAIPRVRSTLSLSSSLSFIFSEKHIIRLFVFFSRIAKRNLLTSDQTRGTHPLPITSEPNTLPLLDSCASIERERGKLPAEQLLRTRCLEHLSPIPLFALRVGYTAAQQGFL